MKFQSGPALRFARGSSLAVLTALALLALWATLATPALAQNSTDDLPVVERHRYTTIHALPDGRKRAVITIHAQNYQRPDGSWAAIREQLDAAGASSGMDFECLENGLVSRFGTASGVPTMTAHAQGGAPITMTANGLVSRDASGTVIEQLAPWSTTSQQIAPNAVEYPGVYTGATDEYIVAAERVKHTLYLDAPALQVPGGAQWIGGSYRISLPAGHSLTTPDGTPVTGTITTDGWLAISVNGEVAYRLHPVIVTDADGTEGPGRYTVTVNGDGTVELVMEADVAWATDPARALPIAIDPTLSLQPAPAAGKDTHIREQSANTNYGTGSNIGSNYGADGDADWLLVLIQFDVSAIPVDATVDSVSMELWHWGNQGSYNMSLHVITQAWAENTVTWANQPTFNDANADNELFSNAQDLWRFWTNHVATCQGWVDGSITNNGFLLRNDNRNKFFLYFYSSDYTVNTTLRPKYVVDYTENLGLNINSPAAGAMADGYLTEAYSQTVTAQGGVEPYAWNISAGALPDGLTLDPDTGEISGTPTATGSFSFTVRVVDQNADQDTRAYTIDVYSLPSITGPAAGALAQGTQNAPNPYANPSVQVTATGGSPALSFSATGLPTNVTINSSSGVISGTPGSTGFHSITVTVTDANGKQDSRNYSILINPPVSIDSTSLPNANDGQPYSHSMSSTGGTAIRTWSMVITPALPGISINTSNGQISGSTTLGSAGTYSVDITITDHYGSTDTVNLTLVVEEFAGAIGTGGGGCSCAADTAPAARSNNIQFLWIVALLLTMAAIRRRRG